MRSITLFLLLFLTSIARLGGQPAERPPNIVVFVADDAGLHLGCYGDAAARTPNLDALAANGLRCTQAFLTTPQCSPSRTSILAGQYAHTIGTEDLHTPLDGNTLLLPAHLRHAGYYTGFMLKGHLGPNGHRQFDWHDEGDEDYQRGEWNDRAADHFAAFLDAAGDRPFFMWVGFVDPHRPYGDAPNAAPRVVNPASVRTPPYLVDAPATRRDLADYYDEMARLDDHVGQMIAQLLSRGLLDNTLVVFLADNGYPFPRAKGTLYDAGIQTPLIFYWPGRISAGGVYEGLISLIDLAPTLLEVAGLSPPPNMYGRGIAGIFSDPSLPGRDMIFAERNWHDCDEHMRCVRTDRFKLIINAYTELPHGTPADLSSSPSWFDLKAAQRDGRLSPAQSLLFAAPRPAVEFYDLREDPFELNNLADRPVHQTTIAMLVDQLKNWRKATNDHPWWRRRRADHTCRVTGVWYGDREDFWRK